MKAQTCSLFAWAALICACGAVNASPASPGAAPQNNAASRHQTLRGNVAEGSPDNSAAVAALGPLPAHPVLSDILARHLAALGGEVALKAIHNTRETMSVRAGGMTGTGITVFATPDKAYDKISVGPFSRITATDGTTTWMTDSGDPTNKLEDDDLRDEQTELFINSYSYVLPGLRPGKVTLLPGTESESGDYVILAEPFGGNAVKLFIDPRTFLIARDEEAGDGDTTVTVYRDYRLYNGVMFATANDQSGGDPPASVSIKVTKIEINVALAPDLFTKPAPTQSQTATFITPGSHSVSDVTCQINGNLCIDCAVNGLPVTLILDSGSPGFFLSEDIVKKLHLEEQGHAQVTGYGGDSDIRFVNIDSLEVRNCVKLSNIVGYAENESMLSSKRTQGRMVAGIIGGELLSKFVVQIDYKTNRVTLIDPNTFQPDPSYGVALPVELGDGTPIVAAHLDNLPEAKYMVDTGDTGALTVNWPYVKAHGLCSIYKHGRESIRRGTGGLSFGWGTRVAAFTVAGTILKDVPADLSQDKVGGGSAQFAGSIGAAFLSHFIVTFDYPHNRLFLKPNPRSNSQFITGYDVPEKHDGLKYAPSGYWKMGTKNASPAVARTRAAIQAACNDQLRAIANKNVDVYMSFLADDFSRADPDGSKMSRDELRQDLVNTFAKFAHISGSSTIVSFVLKGNEAYVIVKKRNLMQVLDPATQKLMPLRAESIDKQVWRKVRGVWKEASTAYVSGGVASDDSPDKQP